MSQDPPMPIKLYPVVLLVMVAFVLSVMHGGFIGVLLVAGWLASGGKVKSIQTYLYGSGLFFLVILSIGVLPVILMMGAGWVDAARVVLPPLACAGYLVWVTTRADVRAYLEAYDARRERSS